MADHVQTVLNLFCLTPALPLLFILSGYLFFRNAGEHFDWKRDYADKLKNRVGSLYLFYVTCCVLSIAYKVILKHEPLPTLYDFLLGFWPLDSDVSLHGFGMWYIRSLIAFSILAPLYWAVVRTLKHFCLPLCLCLSLAHLPITFVYFNWYLLFGCYLAYVGISLSSGEKFLDWRAALLAAFALRGAEVLCDIPLPEAAILPLFFTGLIGFFSRYPLPRILTAASTFIYMFHFFLTGGIKHALFAVLPHNEGGYIANLLLNWAIMICICYAVFLIIRRFKILCLLLTGGRG